MSELIDELQKARKQEEAASADEAAKAAARNAITGVQIQERTDLLAAMQPKLRQRIEAIGGMLTEEDKILIGGDNEGNMYELVPQFLPGQSRRLVGFENWTFSSAYRSKVGHISFPTAVYESDQTASRLVIEDEATWHGAPDIGLLELAEDAYVTAQGHLDFVESAMRDSGRNPEIAARIAAREAGV